MPVILTSVGRVRDWKALNQLHRTVLLEQARDLGVTGYRLCRDADDASRMLIVVEGPDHETIQDLARALDEHLAALVEVGTGDQWIWEPMEVAEVG